MTKSLKMGCLVLTSMLMAVLAQVNGEDCFSEKCENNCCDSSSLINVKAELLYLRPQLCGLESAFGNTAVDITTVSGFTTTTITECDREPTSKWNPGFRIEADTMWECLLVEARWTHFNGSAHFHDGNQHGNWKIRYDVIDFILGRSFSVGSCVEFIPYIGVRGAQIRQSLHSHLETFFTGRTANNIVFSDKDEKENFWGVGPEIGLEFDFCLGCNFSLYGRANVISYYGDVRSKGFNTDIFATSARVCHGRKSHCFNTVGTDLELGICWDKTMCFCCTELDFMILLGFEQHRIYDFSELGSDGTLSLDGGFIGAGIGFRY